MKFDHHLPAAPLGEVPGRAEWAQRVGCDGVFSADTAREPFLPIALAASAAPGLDFGTAIAAAFARSPMVVAQTAWALAELTGGRFLLGLGSQIKAHVERRFSMPWGAPAARLAEFIGALRAIWETWQTGGRLRFRGDFYSHTLMTPFFDPGPIEHPNIPVYIAGVGPRMSRLAGEMCDGFHVHPFHTVRYLREVTLPAIAEGAARAGRPLDRIELASTVFVITGRDEAELADMRRRVRQQIAFYASTPAYRRVLEVHGWDFGPRLTALSKRGEWTEMGKALPDEAVAEVAVEAPLDRLGEAIRNRYTGLLDRIGFYGLEPGTPDMTEAEWTALVKAIRG